MSTSVNGQRYALATRDVIARVIDGEAIIINLASGLYYSTRAAGAVVWAGLEAGYPLIEIINSVRAQFAVSSEVAEVDVNGLIGEMLAEHLIRTDGVLAGEFPSVPPPETVALPYETPSLVKFSDMAQFLALDPPLPSLEP